MSSIQRIAKPSDPKWTKDLAKRRVRTVREEQNYFLPGDLAERARLKLQDDLMLLVWGKLFYAPLPVEEPPSVAHIDAHLARGTYSQPNPKLPLSIIDIACGDALWGYQVAKLYPEARVVNLDVDKELFKALVQEQALPNNFEFLQRDALVWPLPFPDGSFSFVHSRFPDTLLSHELFPDFLREIERICNPRGGWCEIVVADYPTIETPTKVIERYYQAAYDLPLRLGLCGAGGPRIQEYLEKAEIKGYRYKCKVVGRNQRQHKLLINNILASLQGMKGYLDQMGLLPLAEFDRNWRQFSQDLAGRGYTMKFHRVWWRPDPSRQKVMWLPLKREPLSKPEEG